jgi:histidinol-phosphate aminotransferase
MIRLHMNENPLGMSPLVIEHIKEAAPLLSQYPSPKDEAHLLIAIALRYGVETSQIVLGNGTSEILDLIARAYLNKATTSVYSQYSFELVDRVTKQYQAVPVVVSAISDYKCDVDAVIRAVDKDTAIVWLINPNNPTGSLLSAEDIQRVLDKVPSTTIVVLDEAYIEYVPVALRFDSIKALERYKNLIICRTFSKIYGLAGVRIGFAITSTEIAAQLNALRLPVSSNKVALIAAYAALKDQAFVEQSFMHVATEREYLTKTCVDMGVTVLPSYTNFITIELEDAADFVQCLVRKNILVRWLDDYGLSYHIRISIGTRADHLQLLDCLSTYIKRKER